MTVVQLLKVICSVQALGLAWHTYAKGSPFESYLFIEIGISESISRPFELGIAGLAVVAAAWLWRDGRQAAWPGIILGVIFTAFSLLAWKMGGKFAVELALPAHATRIAAPFALAWLAKDGAMEPLLKGIRWAIAITFVTHGIEALWHHPVFIDYLIGASRKLLGMSLLESDARTILNIIGAVDLLVAVLLVLSPSWQVAAWMVFWGLITAGSRIVYGEWNGISDFAIRIANWGLPLIILIHLRKK